MNISELSGVWSVYARRLSSSYDFGNIFDGKGMNK